MLDRSQKLALFMEGALTDPSGKMGFGVLRYSPNPVVCVIDSGHAGKRVQDVIDTPRSCPVVASMDEAAALGAEVIVLGIAPGGGLIPGHWWPAIDEAVGAGMSIVNGLHDLVGPRYPDLPQGQWIWDVRLEPEGLSVGTGAASELDNTRVLMIGTDMAVGKMTAGLEILRGAKQRGIRADFVATGQIGITVTGAGIPLDAVRVDFASGAVEREVLRARAADLVIVEGQGSLVHPASSATLPLLRGSCPTHFILCHRAGQQTLLRVPSVRIPDLREFCGLYESLAAAVATFPRPKTVGIALNTAHLGFADAVACIEQTERETGLPCTDPVRIGPDKLLDALGKKSAPL